MKVITRFAPSPTGFLHIGGARTALFNYLFSKHNNGKFLLRIEDTDKKRSTQPAIDAIIDGLSWLNLNWDNNIVMQSENIKAHQEAAFTLLENGKAYYCYCPPKNLQDHTLQEKCNCINLKQSPKDISPAIRLRVDKEGISSIEDLVIGKVDTPKKDIDDFIILRADKTPTYLLAVVVDDINMSITHIIRGNDHLSNTFKQKEIFEALNKPLPYFAHIPLIHGEDGSKLSKRHGALGIEEYKKMGYLNRSVNNYLLKLGWSFNNQDIISISEATKNFNIKDVQKSASRFDFNKLNSINSYYIKSLSLEDLFTYVITFMDTTNSNLLSNYKHNLYKILPFLQTRFQTLKDIAEASLFVLHEKIKISPEAQEIIKNNITILKEQYCLLKSYASDFDREELHKNIKDFSENTGLKLGVTTAPLRAALSGNSSSPASVFDIMNILGKEQTLLRINNAIKLISK